MSTESLSARYGALVGGLEAALASGDESAFRGAFERLRAELNVEMNPELRRITENVQEALRQFRREARLEVLADQEVPDARRRLAHVVKLTEDAAHRTLDLVEQSGPLVDRIGNDAAQLLEEWSLHGSRQLAVSTFWPERAYETLERAVRDTDLLRRYLGQMLLAQGYQDLSGQIIHAVINLAVELENVLGELVKLTRADDASGDPASDSPTMRDGMGPQIPGIMPSAEIVGGQDDIDALLASVAGGHR